VGWNVVSEGRWAMDGTVRHMLQQAGTRLVELHDDTVHVYDAVGPVDEVWPLGSPEDPDAEPAAVWVRSEVRSELAGMDDDAAWAAINSDNYMKGQS
jgi:hypothetical protein